jgi:hypothetical protein
MTTGAVPAPIQNSKFKIQNLKLRLVQLPWGLPFNLKS